MKSPKAQQPGRCPLFYSELQLLRHIVKKETNPKKDKPLYDLHGSNAKMPHWTQAQ